MKELFELFVLFAHIGSVTFGGGYAMLPILSREFVDKRGWVTNEELADYFAIGQCTPGIIAVNVSTFIGNKRKGLLGGIVATIGLIFIPMIIITIIAAFLSGFAEYTIIKNAFAGIRVSVCVLIFNAVLQLWKKSIVNTKSLIIFIVVFACSVILPYTSIDISPVILVIGAAIVGLVVKSIGGSEK